MITIRRTLEVWFRWYKDMAVIEMDMKWKKDQRSTHIQFIYALDELVRWFEDDLDVDFIRKFNAKIGNLPKINPLPVEEMVATLSILEIRLIYRRLKSAYYKEEVRQYYQQLDERHNQHPGSGELHAAGHHG